MAFTSEQQTLKARWKTQFQKIDGNSKFHDEVRVLLAEDSVFRKLRCFQEVPVADICEGYLPKSHRFDWYLEDLGIVLELHGRQHYHFTNRGNAAYDKAKQEFTKSKIRDEEKMMAAIDSGLEYKVISYKLYGKLTPQKLKDILFKET